MSRRTRRTLIRRKFVTETGSPATGNESPAAYAAMCQRCGAYYVGFTVAQTVRVRLTNGGRHGPGGTYQRHRIARHVLNCGGRNVRDRSLLVLVRACDTAEAARHTEAEWIRQPPQIRLGGRLLNELTPAYPE